MTDAPAPSGDFTLERAQELIELIAELPVKNTYERIIALQHDALAAERERVKALTVEWKDANANWVRHRKAAEIAEARATAAEAKLASREDYIEELEAKLKGEGLLRDRICFVEIERDAAEAQVKEMWEALEFAHDTLKFSRRRIIDTSGPSSWLDNVTNAMAAVEIALAKVPARATLAATKEVA